jgi:hypothetical protein
LGWAATRHSPGIDEVGHLAAGLHHWRTGTFESYRVNPPLVRLIATTPLVASGIDLPKEDLNTAPPARPEFDLGRRLVDQKGEEAFWYFTLARWACIPFALIGTVVIYVWGSSLYGWAAGLLSATLWVVCPNVLAHAQMITPDTGAAGLGLTACYLFWRWLQRPNWTLTLWAGMILGLAELSKTTWVLLVPVWVASWAIYAIRNSGRARSGGWTELRQLTAILLTALCVLNAGYGFEDVGRSLREYRFVSRALTNEAEDGTRVNRFVGTWVGRVPVPLPRNYVQGIDVQKRDFESGKRSYLRGEWRTEGWWYYYLYGLVVKTPIGTLVVFGMAALNYALCGGSRFGWRDELILLLPGLVVLTFVSSQTGLNHHLRYVLPALPFLFVWAGRAAVHAESGRVPWQVVVGAATLGTVISSLGVYPHCMSYFNEAAGGPYRGSEHLVNSNIDWGQDLLYLRRWLDEHAEARPLGLAYFGYVDPRSAGIAFTLPPKGPTKPADFLEPRQEAVGPRPGWYAVSVSMLRGFHYPIPNGVGGRAFVEGECYGYFLRFRPVASAGYSIWIYHLEPGECDRVRTEMGLPPLGG